LSSGRVGAAWGIAGVVVLLSSAVGRLAAFAIAAVRSGLTPSEWAAFWASVAFFAYTNGYRVFQRQWSPRIVARAQALHDDPTPLRVALAPLFCMSYFDATRKRMGIAWGVTFGVVILVVLVRQLAQPWRGIIDAGVVVGLAWAVVAIVWFAVRALRGHAPPASPELGD
jgi:hypothetical protein